MKDETLSLRIASETKEILQKAALLKHKSLTEYSISILLDQAKKDIGELQKTYGTLLKAFGVTAPLIELRLETLESVGETIASLARMKERLQAIKEMHEMKDDDDQLGSDYYEEIDFKNVEHNEQIAAALRSLPPPPEHTIKPEKLK